jgi:hypothetical protein
LAPETRQVRIIVDRFFAQGKADDGAENPSDLCLPFSGRTFELDRFAPILKSPGQLSQNLGFKLRGMETKIIELKEQVFNAVTLSGGIVPKETKDGDHGTVLVASFRALKAGKAAISMKDGQLLAANGEGTNIITGSNVLTLYIHDQGKISPDMNGDGVLSISDVNTLYLKTFRAYNPRYDLNGDGKVSWADVKMLIELM